MDEEKMKEQLLAQYRSACLAYARECRSYTAFNRKDKGQRFRLLRQKERILGSFKDREFAVLVWNAMHLKRRVLRQSKKDALKRAEKRMLRLKLCVTEIW